MKQNCGLVIHTAHPPLGVSGVLIHTLAGWLAAKAEMGGGAGLRWKWGGGCPWCKAEAAGP